MSNEKHFHGWLRSGRVFVMSPKVFYGPDSLPSMGKKTATGSGRSARACLLELSNLAAIEAAAG